MDREPPDEEMVQIIINKFDLNNKNKGRITIEGFNDKDTVMDYTNGYYEMLICGYDTSDMVSGVDNSDGSKVCYYVADSNIDYGEIKDIKLWNKYSNGFVVHIENEDFKIIVKIEDNEGNVSYACTGRFIIDREPPVINEFDILSESNINGFYNNDVKFSLSVTDNKNDCSGVDFVEYSIECDKKTTADWKRISENKEGRYNIRVPAIDNNGDVYVLLRVWDRAGNTICRKSKLIKIDSIRPEIYMEYDNNDVINIIGDDKGYYNKKRILTLTIVEDRRSFNPDNALRNIKIYINGKYGEIPIENFTDKKWNHSANRHSIKFIFETDGEYRIVPSYIDDAGNSNSDIITKKSKTPYDFVIDCTRPKGYIHVIEKDWKYKRFNKNITYKKFSDKEIKFDIQAFDDTGGVKSIYYFVLRNGRFLSVSDLEKLDEEMWKEYVGVINERQNGYLVVYARIEDCAGNVSYINTNGILIDDVPPDIEISVMGDEKEIYNSDVRMLINVYDKNVSGAYSGIKNVKYTISNKDKITQEGVLYLAKEKENVYNGEIIVESSLNNSNYISICICAEDNAGNISEEKKFLKIDTELPVINISYNNNDGRVGDDQITYFKDSRTAHIVVRDTNIELSNIEIDVYGSDGENVSVLQWEKDMERENVCYHTTIIFDKECEYYLNINCTDKAGNISQINCGDSISPWHFTIDKTINPVKIVYDNNESHNGVYYADERKAKIIINEKNFNVSAVEIDIKGYNDNGENSMSYISDWINCGDVHMADVLFKDDGFYIVNVRYEDKAGNVFIKSEADSFYIDKTIPKVFVKGVNDKSANSEEKIQLNMIVTDYSIESAKAKLTVLTLNNGEYKQSVISPHVIKKDTGYEFVYNNLKEDGIYILECFAVDKAGNKYVNDKTKSAKLMTFTVNRNGSVFYYSNYAKELSNKYYVRDVKEDIVIEEINPDYLKDTIVILNGDTLENKVDYHIKETGKDCEWKKYVYTIDKSLMKKDGEYNLTIKSEDMSGGVSYSDMKNMKIRFVVDNKKPEVTISGIASNGRYDKKSVDVRVKIRDDGGKVRNFKAVLVKTNEVLCEIKEDELNKYLDDNKGIIKFTVPEVIGENINITCSDYSCDEFGKGNTFEKTYKNITISENKLVLFYANKKLLFVTFGFFFLIQVFLVYVICLKKKGQRMKNKLK